MSYLDRPRLTFYGRFTANPSTINNFPANYGGQLPYQPGSWLPGSIWWNPFGTHQFSLDDCAVTGLVMDGDSGPVQGTVATSQNGVLVDLDTQQQLVSQIIGMQLTITVGAGSVSGTFFATNFADINFGRASGTNINANGDGTAGAAYQSVLQNLTWNAAGSPFLVALQKASPDMLSIRMNVDAHHGNFGDPLFPTGRVAGTIGPYLAGEPFTFTNARFLRPTGWFVPGAQAPPQPSSYAAGWNAVPAKLDTQRKKLVVDLGNATPWVWNIDDEGPVSAVQSVEIATVSFNGTTPANVIATLPTSVDTSDAAYQANAFVQELDVPDDLLSAVASTALGVVSNGTIQASENPTGAYINGESWVFRLNPEQTGDVTLYANTFGAPAAGVNVALGFTSTVIQSQAAGGPPTGGPPTACTFGPSVTTDGNGKAKFTITAAEPNYPRLPIPGQVYGVGWSWSEDVIPDQWNFASVKVFDAPPVPEAPTWWGDIYPILSQYAYLYPAMQEIIQLDNYDDVVANASAIIQRLTLPDDNAGQMPITRELSATQRATLVKWMQSSDHPAGTPPAPQPAPIPLPPEPITIYSAT